MSTINSAHATSDTAIDLARQILYRFAACSLQDPRTDNWRRFRQFQSDALVGEAAAYLRSIPSLEAEELGPGEQPLRKLRVHDILECLPESGEALNAEYEQTFGLLVSSPCPPYETEYIDSKFAFQRSNALADINGFYHAFGLKMSEACPDRSDHIVPELEFMTRLIGLERSAAEIAAPEYAERQQVCRDAQQRFLREHLTWWTPAFAKLLCKANPGGFYAAVGVFLGSFMAAERALFGLPVGLKPVWPSVPEAQELCAACAVGGAAIS